MVARRDAETRARDRGTKGLSTVIAGPHPCLLVSIRAKAPDVIAIVLIGIVHLHEILSRVLGGRAVKKWDPCPAFALSHVISICA
jgi:hypothetical protein